MSQYSVAEARNNLPRLIDRALAGETVTITRRGAEVARLTGVRPKYDANASAAFFERIGPPIELENPSGESGAEIIRKMRDEEPGY